MRHVYKACPKGEWKAPCGSTYDVKNIHVKEKNPKGYVDSLEKALKKKAPKSEPQEVLIGENG